MGAFVAVLIPAYQPTARLLSVLSDIRARSDMPILLVDDGSGRDFAAIFARAVRIPRVVLLRNAVNLGKGAALRHGMNSLLTAHPDAVGVITADADGQHSPDDIVRVADELRNRPDRFILGVRKFGPGTPLRSRIGNGISRLLYQALLGISLEDTQTGLRGVPHNLMERSLSIRQNRYDFETAQLIAAASMGLEFVQVPIATIYEANNASSHFDPFVDSVRIYSVVVRHSLSSC